ncbi:MAG: beta-ketoacyl synthase chain length factor [Nitrosospira sp.]
MVRTSCVSFSIARHAAWAPGLTTPEAWLTWAQTPFIIEKGSEPSIKKMPSMLRRRAGHLGKMALEVAYQCLNEQTDVPTVFCSRHGDVARAIDLLTELVQGNALSPTSFSMAVHNASVGLFSIARKDSTNHIALAGGRSTVEHGVIEACALLADGAPMVLLVACDFPLPSAFTTFQDCNEQPYAWSWLMVPPYVDTLSLSWTACASEEAAAANTVPAGLSILRFQLGREKQFERVANHRRWQWTRND